MTTVDALIIGAGPAGLAAAIVLGRIGLRVAICERGSLPRDKPCGEGVMPTGVRHLDELGALDRLDPRQLRPLQGIRFQSASGSIATARFAEGHGLGIRRTNLSTALVEVVRDWPNVELRQGVCIRQLIRTSNGFRAELAEDAVHARLVVGADGLNSWVRRWAGLEGRPQARRRLGARQHFTLPPWSSYVEVTQGRGIEVYVTPCGEDQVGVAFLWEKALFAPVREGRELIASLLEVFPDLERRLARAPASSTALASGPLHRVARRRTAHGVLLVGDAGGYLDACTGEGVSVALAEALALESTVVPLLKQIEGVPTARDLSAYSQACRRLTRPYEIGTRLQLYLCRHPRFADRIVRALAQDQDLMAHWLSANMGTGRFWPGWQRAARLSANIVCNATASSLDSHSLPARGGPTESAAVSRRTSVFAGPAGRERSFSSRWPAVSSRRGRDRRELPTPRRRCPLEEVDLTELPDDIRRFIAANIVSVAQLELLLLMRGDPEREWTADEVSRVLYAAPGGMFAQLADLEAKGLVCVTHAPEPRFRYQPRAEELGAVVGRLAEIYKERRVAVISLIYSQPSDKARSFAEAFRIRKDKEQ